MDINMERIKNIFKDGGVLSKKNPFYKQRDSQVEASCLIEYALKNKLHFILEGPTGFGKTFSYLIPSIKNLIEDNYDGQIVVVTSNISLQDQLYEKDIPYILDIMNDIYPKKRVKSAIKPSLIKGIGNFLCIDKIESEEFQNSIELFNDIRMKEVYKFYSITKDGDITKAPFILNQEEIKKVVCSNTSECKSDLCEHKVDCFYNKQKLKSVNSKIIVTNYHMLYACEASRSTLFKNASIFIFDEVHEADNILREFESKTITSGTVEYIERKITEIRNNAGRLYSSLALFDIDRLKDSSNYYFEQIKDRYTDKIEFSPMLVTSTSDLPCSEDFVLNIKNVIKTLNSIQMKITQTLDTLSCEDFGEDSQYDLASDMLSNSSKKLLMLVNSLLSTCTSIIDMISGIEDILNDDNKVMYIEKNRNRIIIGIKDMSVAPKFKRYFLNDPDVSCILASATISIDGNFEYFKEKLGLNTIEGRVMEYIGDSPFDLTEQQLWYLPKTVFPGNSKEFDEVLPYQVEEIIKASNGGALCLFTSNKNLRMCKEFLVNAIPEYKILTQGDKSRHLLLEEFKDDYNSSLLATKSFFTGIDVPGQSLRVVVVDKLPFTAPTDPVQQKLSSKPGYFVNYSLNEMIINLKQAIGRGVRSITDRVIVVVLDERIISANYSKKIIQSFPYPKVLTRDLNEVSEFLEIK